MMVSRRGFFALCRNSAGALGLGALELSSLENLMASPTAPTVLWLQGAACSGCSVSFLNYVSTSAPKTAADVLISTINLEYHPTLMGAAGDLASTVVNNALANGNYILVVEGGIPTAFGGNSCIVWTTNGAGVTMQQAVTSLAGKASQVICFGTCSSFGGVPAAPPNPAGIRTVKAVTLRNTINIPGCPPHPSWMVWAVVHALGKTIGPLDANGRPTAIYGKNIHDNCPRQDAEDATAWGQDNRCYESLGCYGPSTNAPCYAMKWNNARNWCVDANASCLGCVNPSFPGKRLRGNGGN